MWCFVAGGAMMPVPILAVSLAVARGHSPEWVVVGLGRCLGLHGLFFVAWWTCGNIWCGTVYVRCMAVAWIIWCGQYGWHV